MLITPLVASNLFLLILLRILLGLGEGLGLPMIFQLFAANVPVSERSRAFGYLISAGTVGQTLAALLTPHIYWPLAFYKFGFLGIGWTYFWFTFYYRSFADESRKTVISLEAPSITGGDAEAPLIIGSGGSKTPAFPGVPSSGGRWSAYAAVFLTCWPLWAIYIAHFAMNWSNYIIMQWFPYYLSRYLGADSKSLSLTAVPYIVNSIAGIGKFRNSIFKNRFLFIFLLNSFFPSYRSRSPRRQPDNRTKVALIARPPSDDGHWPCRSWPLHAQLCLRPFPSSGHLHYRRSNGLLCPQLGRSPL